MPYSTAPGPVSFAILGCGARGQRFSNWVASEPAFAKIVAIAEPNEARRALVGDRHAIPMDRRFHSYESLLSQPRLADAVINTLMDRQHADSSLQAMELGYHMLLEKPMAVSLSDCIAIDAARRRTNRIVSVCHSLRYHPSYREVKRRIDAGEIGQIVSVDQLEGVDPVHQSHSFVRGNWGNESRSTFMLMAKSCHDIDILLYLMGSACERVNSFGRLSHFNKANQPTNAPPRCSDGCPHEAECPYSALKVYGQGKSWGRYIGLDRLTQAQRDEFVRTDPLGRCAYDVDNDAVDHQVVSFEFANGATGTFTMTAFAPAGRHLRLHGTRGYIAADIDGHRLQLHRFWGAHPGQETIEIAAETGGHGGGDDNVIRCLIRAIREKNPSLVLTGTDESVRTHLATFAAERSRREKRIIEISELSPVPKQM